MISSVPISIPNIKTLAQILRDILLTRFQCYFIRKTITKMGDNSDKKEHRSPIFSWGIHIWNFKTLAYMVLNLCNAHESNRWPKIAKGHNSQQNFIKIVEILISWSPPQLQSTKYQGSSSNTFCDVLLTRLQCYFISRAMTLKWEIIRIKQNTSHLFFLEESVYEISKP